MNLNFATKYAKSVVGDGKCGFPIGSHFPNQKSAKLISIRNCFNKYSIVITFRTLGFKVESFSVNYSNLKTFAFFAVMYINIFLSNGHIWNDRNLNISPNPT